MVEQRAVRVGRRMVLAFVLLASVWSPQWGCAAAISLGDVVSRPSGADSAGGEGAPRLRSAREQEQGAGGRAQAGAASVEEWCRSALSDPSMVRSREDAERLLEFVTEHGEELPPTLSGYSAVVKALERCSPSSGAPDLARALRRLYYSDEQLEVLGVRVAEGEPVVSEEARKWLWRLYPVLKRWKDVRDGEGRLMDVSHALVALDVYSHDKPLPVAGRVRGRLKAYLFTYGGDYVTQVFSFFGMKEAGGWNRADHRGNTLGRRVVWRYAADEKAALSDLMLEAAGSPRGLARWLVF